MALFLDNLAEHTALMARLAALEPEVARAGALCSETLRRGSKLLLCGNGGSAADCQHIASELTGRFIADRRALAALTLTTDTSALTSIGNDYAFDEIFARQLAGLGRAGDVLIGISTSGRSPNVLRAVAVAREMNIRTIALTGKDGGPLRTACDVAIVVPSPVTARIQEAHSLIGHTLCGLIERELGLDGAA
jgi:D-sedoheptulose 7-phosphate isomerase